MLLPSLVKFLLFCWSTDPAAAVAAATEQVQCPRQEMPSKRVSLAWLATDVALLFVTLMEWTAFKGWTVGLKSQSGLDLVNICGAQGLERLFTILLQAFEVIRCQILTGKRLFSH
jgi:hypothetical protein